MPIAWILIIVTGTAVGTHEFHNEQACNAAVQKILEANSDATAFCIADRRVGNYDGEKP